MDCNTDPTPVIPVLAYANPRGGQPAGSLFTVEEHEDGVTLSKPLRAEPFMAVAIVLLSCLTLSITVGSFWHVLFERDRGNNLPAQIAGTIVFASITAGLLFREMPRTMPRILVIELRTGKLTVTNGPAAFTKRQWIMPRPARFKNWVGSTNLKNLRPLYEVFAVNRFGVARTILKRAPTDECVWMAELLNNHLALIKKNPAA